MLSRLRADQLMQGLNSSARKVFDLVPIATAWTKQQVNAEMRRSGVNLEPHIVMGCLAKLMELGLVVEPATGTFQRAQLREPAARLIPKQPPQQEPAMAGTTTLPPLTKGAAPAVSQQPQPADKPKLADHLGALAGELVSKAKRLSEIAMELETVALAFEEQLGKDTAELAQLRQMRAFLKGL